MSMFTRACGRMSAHFLCSRVANGVWALLMLMFTWRMGAWARTSHAHVHTAHARERVGALLVLVLMLMFTRSHPDTVLGAWARGHMDAHSSCSVHRLLLLGPRQQEQCLLPAGGDLRSERRDYCAVAEL
jgi:hypothetical protein